MNDFCPLGSSKTPQPVRKVKYELVRVYTLLSSVTTLDSSVHSVCHLPWVHESDTHFALASLITKGMQ